MDYPPDQTIPHQIQQLETLLSFHQQAVTQLQEQLAQLRTQTTQLNTNPPAKQQYPLALIEYKRYGRQLILPSIGLSGQHALKNASVLIVGAGGLGCPASIYLAGAGVGHIGIVDGDTVELSNLHRQILHGGSIGVNKAVSAVRALTLLNPLPKYTAYTTHLTPQNSSTIFSQYDLILDCTDTPSSRYLISDTSILLQKPLISASALTTEGQLLVLNCPAAPPGDKTGGPCYRCIFPRPPPPESVLTCGEGGILGPVVGVMGVLQAMEAVKVLTTKEGMQGMLLFSAFSMPMFRSVKMRGRKVGCVACSESATVTREGLESGSLDYVQFCGAVNGEQLLRPEERVTAQQYGKLLESGKQGIVVDVREQVQFDLCHLEGSVNLPFSEITRSEYSEDAHVKLAQRMQDMLSFQAGETPIHVVCRLGNDSQVAVQKFKQLGLDGQGQRWMGDLAGGLRAWRTQVDPLFPDY